MRQLVPTLLSISMLAAADGSVERSLRGVEGSQRGVTQLTEQTATRADQLSDDLRYNRIGDVKDADQVKALAGDLTAFTVARSDRTTMPWVQERLAAARRAGGGKDLAEAQSGQGQLTEELDKLARNARGRLSGANGAEGLRAAIEAQKRLLDQTKDLGDKLLGKNRDELSTQEKTELERLANQQKGMEDALKEAGDELKEQAKGEENANEKGNLEKAAQKLEDTKAANQAKKAADQLSENNLAEAQRRQQALLDDLEKADRELSGMNQDRQAELDKQMQKMQQMQKRQEDLLKQTQEMDKNASQEQFDQKQAAEADLADEMKGQDQKDAAQDAKEAQEALKNKDKKGAEQEMKQALDKMQKAMQKMQQEMQQLQQQRQKQDQPPPPGPPPPPTDSKGEPPESSNLEEGKRVAKKKKGWQVGLEPQEREVLSQVKAEKFPGRYEAALVEYYRALAGEEEK